MNQLVEKFCDFSLGLSYCEHAGNLIRTMGYKYGVELDVKTATLSGIIVCLSIWIYHVSKRRPGPGPSLPRNPDHSRCYWLGEIHGGDLVLQRLEQFNEAQVNPATLANTENLLRALLQEEYLDLMKLQKTATKLEMSGSEDSAVKILEDEVKKARDKKQQHEAYEIEMFLVEMLIYKGDSEKALNCECLKHEAIRDKRRPLYKAIIYKMKDDTKQAKQFWDDFVEARDPCLDGDSYETNYSEFEKLVNGLQQAIKNKKKSAVHNNVK